MARVTAEGIEPTTLQGYIDALEAAFRTALGADLDLAPETPQSQLIGVLALTLAEADEALVAVGNGMARSRALGAQLDDLGSLLGIPRLEGETDDEYRARYGRLTMRNARGSTEAILAAVLSVDGVTDALIRENATGGDVTVQGKLIGANSVCIVAEGSTDADVAAAIARSKPAGTGTSGSTTVDVPHVGGWTVPIAFSRTRLVPIAAQMTLALEPGFPSDGTSRLILQVMSHVAALPLGEHLNRQRLLVDLFTTVPGHTGDLRVGRKSGTVVTGTGTVADLVNFHGRATVLTGTGTVASLTTLQGITNGTVTFLGQTVTGLDFSDATDYDGVAAVLQTALRATSSTDLDNAEVDYDSTASAFVVTLPLDSSTGVVPTVSAAFTGDDADELGLDTATIVNGVDAIVSGSVTFLGQTVTGLDFSSVTDYDDVAAVLQTGLRATSSSDLDNVEVAYDSTASAFVVTVPLAEDGNPVTVTGALTGDTADELGLDTVEIVQGSVTSQDDLDLVERLTVTTGDITITVS